MEGVCWWSVVNFCSVYIMCLCDSHISIVNWVENSITSNYVYDLVEKLLNKESHETGYVEKEEEEDEKRKNHGRWCWWKLIEFHYKSLKFKSQRSFKWNFRLFLRKKKLNVNERKLSTKYVGNLKINISSDSSTHQQKAAKIKRNKRNIELQASKEFKKKKLMQGVITS